MISNIEPTSYESIVDLFQFKKKKMKKRKKVIHTEEKNRGGAFITKFKLLKILLDNKKNKIYDKEILAKLYFQSNFVNDSQKRYVDRIMSVFEKINITYLCNEKGTKLIKTNSRVGKKYWKLNKNALKDLGL